jgi:hypothetical protein
MPGEYPPKIVGWPFSSEEVEWVKPFKVNRIPWEDAFEDLSKSFAPTEKDLVRRAINWDESRRNNRKRHIRAFQRDEVLRR